MDAMNTVSRNPEGAMEVRDVAPRPARPARGAGHWWMLAAVIALVSVVVLRGIGRGEFDYNVDEAQHAVTGLFLADALRDLPLRHPVQYAYQYYAQYPAVAIVHWPPLFYIAEGAGFLLLGPSVVAARLIVLAFTILLLWQWFHLVEEWQDAETAGISAAVLALLPMMLLFEKTVMLEIPSLALGVAAIRQWMRYLRDGDRKSLWRFGFWLSAALLCKQTMVFLPPFCLLTLAVTGKWVRVRSWDALRVGGFIALLTGPFYGLMLVTHGRSVVRDLGSHAIGGIAQMTYYGRILPSSLVLPLMGVSLLGVVLKNRWDRGAGLLMGCWVIAGYGTFTLFGQREPRFSIYFLPPLVYFAGGLMMCFFQNSAVRVVMRGIALLLVGALATQAWAYRRPYIAGYRDAASHLVQTYHSGVVLFDGKVPGDFVFYMRALDPRRQFLVLRKSLYASDIRPNQDTEELVHSQEQLLDMLRSSGVRFIVVQDGVKTDFESQRILREALQSRQFRPLGRFPIESNQRAWQGTSLALYENTAWAPPLGKNLTIRMMTLSHDIVVPLDRFDFMRGAGASAETK